MMFKNRNAKIVPSSSSSDVQREEAKETHSSVTMRVMSLETLFKLYGGQRHPRIESYEILQQRLCLTEYRYMPHGATVIYISHEWVGSELDRMQLQCARAFRSCEVCWRSERG